jgi:hypothetical protein
MNSIVSCLKCLPLLVLKHWLLCWPYCFLFVLRITRSTKWQRWPSSSTPWCLVRVLSSFVSFTCVVIPWPWRFFYLGRHSCSCVFMSIIQTSPFLMWWIILLQCQNLEFSSPRHVNCFVAGICSCWYPWWSKYMFFAVLTICTIPFIFLTCWSDVGK